MLFAEKRGYARLVDAAIAAIRVASAWECRVDPQAMQDCRMPESVMRAIMMKCRA
jgi:hypothetical protein